MTTWMSGKGDRELLRQTSVIMVVDAHAAGIAYLT